MQAACDEGEGTQWLSSGQLCWKPLDFSSNTLSPGQPRQESTSCTSLGAASAGYCMDQHRWLSWKRLLALALRQRYLGLGGREKGALWREMTRKCNSDSQSGENGNGQRSFSVLVSFFFLTRGSTHELWQVQVQLTANSPSKAKKPAPPPPTALPAPAPRGVL